MDLLLDSLQERARSGCKSEIYYYIVLYYSFLYYIILYYNGAGEKRMARSTSHTKGCHPYLNPCRYEDVVIVSDDEDSGAATEASACCLLMVVRDDLLKSPTRSSTFNTLPGQGMREWRGRYRPHDRQAPRRAKSTATCGHLCRSQHMFAEGRHAGTIGSAKILRALALRPLRVSGVSKTAARAARQ